MAFRKTQRLNSDGSVAFPHMSHCKAVHTTHDACDIRYETRYESCYESCYEASLQQMYTAFMDT